MVEVFQGRTVDNLIDDLGIESFPNRNAKGKITKFFIDHSGQVSKAENEIVIGLEMLLQVTGDYISVEVQGSWVGYLVNDQR